MLGGIRLTMLLGLLVFFGCSKKASIETAKASGSVQYKGAPVEGAIVVFLPAAEADAARAAEARTNADGSFAMRTSTGSGEYQDGIPPGEYLVSVRKIEPPPDRSGPPREILPRKYGSPTSSGLKATVTHDDEKNTFELKLTD
jgi:hypothetical protein